MRHGFALISIAAISALLIAANASPAPSLEGCRRDSSKGHRLGNAVSMKPSSASACGGTSDTGRRAA